MLTVVLLFDYIYLFFKIFLVFFFFFFVLRNITKDLHKKTISKSYLYLSVCFLLITFLSFIVDKKVLNLDTNEFVYYFAISISFIFLIVSIYLLTKTKNLPIKIKKEMVYTYKEKIRCVYLFYRNTDYIYLQKETSTGINYQLKRNEFVDEVVKGINKQNYITNDDYDRSGIITRCNSKKEFNYYCYLINVPDDYLNSLFIKVSKYEIHKLEISDFDKFVILNCLSSSNFNLEF